MTPEQQKNEFVVMFTSLADSPAKAMQRAQYCCQMLINYTSSINGAHPEIQRKGPTRHHKEYWMEVMKLLKQ